MVFLLLSLCSDTAQAKAGKDGRKTAANSRKFSTYTHFLCVCVQPPVLENEQNGVISIFVEKPRVGFKAGHTAQLARRETQPSL